MKKSLCDFNTNNSPRYADGDPGISEPGDAVEFFGSGECFNALCIYPVFFVLRIDDKVHIVYIVCRLLY